MAAEAAEEVKDWAGPHPEGQSHSFWGEWKGARRPSAESSKNGDALTVLFL